MSKYVSGTRKLIKWGSSNTLLISLPRKWVSRIGLTPKHEIYLNELSDGSLIVNPKGIVIEEPSTTIETSRFKNPIALGYAMLIKYLDGFSAITVKSKHPLAPEMQDKIKEVVSRLLGFEIVRQTPTEVEFKDIMSIREANIPELIKVLTRQTNELYDTLLSIVKENNPDLVQNILSSQVNIEKYCYRINRQLRKALLFPHLLVDMDLTRQDTVDLAFYISYIADTSTAIASSAKAITKSEQLKPTKELMNFLEKAQELYRDSTRSMLFQQVELAIKILESTAKLKDQKRSVENKLDKMPQTPQNTTLQIILDNVEHSIDNAHGIALTALRRIL